MSSHVIRRLILIGLMVLLAGVLTALNPVFLTAGNINKMFQEAAQIGIVAIGFTLVMITAGIDMSVGGIIAMTAMLSINFIAHTKLPVILFVPITLFVGALTGLVNGFFIARFKLPAFIVTLATLLTLRGIDLVITGGTSISGLPEAFTVIGQDRIFGLRISLLLFVVLAVVIGYALKNHRYLQQAYFIGGNRRAARMSGVKVERFIVFAFVLNAVLAGIAGIVVCSQYGAASVSYGQNAELRVIAATAIGGTSFSGGSGTITGTVLGVIFLAMIYNAFNMSGINTYWQDVAIGVMLLAAVFLGEYLKRRRIART